MKAIALSRRGLVAGLTAAPLASLPAFAAATPVSDQEARFLALIPWFASAVSAAEKARRIANALFDEGEAAAGPCPRDYGPAAQQWWRIGDEVRRRNGYFEAAGRANDLEGPIDEAFERFRDAPMTTLPALAWKARISMALCNEATEALADLTAVAERVAPCA